MHTTVEVMSMQNTYEKAKSSIDIKMNVETKIPKTFRQNVKH